MVRIFIALSIYLFVFLFVSCKNPVTSAITEKPAPGRRDYTWTIDTIKIPFNFLGRISGSSPEDVYAVGQGGGLDETIWHYDGTKWSTDGVSRGISPLCVHSFSRNDVWIAGNEGKIWHYDGIKWTQNLDFKKDNFIIGFQDIWGESSQNIYAVGYADSGSTRRGIILHFDGKIWKEVIIPNYPYDFLRIKKDINGNHKYYLFGTDYSTDGYYLGLFEYDGGNNITKIYETIFDINTYPGFEFIGERLYFTLGRSINIYEILNFKSVLSIKSGNYLDQAWGRSLSDIFLLMKDGIAHYNGTDEEYLVKVSNVQMIADAAIFDKGIFFLSDDFINDQNIMIKGVLK